MKDIGKLMISLLPRFYYKIPGKNQCAYCTMNPTPSVWMFVSQLCRSCVNESRESLTGTVTIQGFYQSKVLV